jgi:hypothetical protein
VRWCHVVQLSSSSTRMQHCLRLSKHCLCDTRGLVKSVREGSLTLSCSGLLVVCTEDCNAHHPTGRAVTWPALLLKIGLCRGAAPRHKQPANPLLAHSLRVACCIQHSETCSSHSCHANIAAAVRLPASVHSLLSGLWRPLFWIAFSGRQGIFVDLES